MRSTDDGGMTGIDEPDLQFVARLQREPDAAVGTDRAGIVRAGIAFRRAPTDRVEPARRDEARNSEALDHARLRNHQEVEHAVGAGEDRRLDDISRTARRPHPEALRPVFPVNGQKQRDFSPFGPKIGKALQKDQ